MGLSVSVRKSSNFDRFGWLSKSLESDSTRRAKSTDLSKTSSVVEYSKALMRSLLRKPLRSGGIEEQMMGTACFPSSPSVRQKSRDLVLWRLAADITLKATNWSMFENANVFEP